MLIEHNRDKLINAAIYFAKNTNKCGITKLMKLLSLLDFTHFRQTGRSVTKQNYFAFDYGPVPKDFYEELNNPVSEISKFIGLLPTEGSRFIKVVARKKFDKSNFSKRELGLLENIATMFKDLSTQDIVKFTHLRNQPWDVTVKTKGLYQPIDLTLKVYDIKDSLSDEDLDEEVKTRTAIEKVFRKC